jgi:hypothetical protein
MMPAFNAERFITRAIGSLVAQAFTDWELIVVDDGSTDRTSDIVRTFGDARITLIRQDNRGEAAARNVALEAAGGQYLAFLDADDVYLADHLHGMVAYLADHPEHDGVYTDGYYVTEDERRVRSLSSRRPPPMNGRVFDALVRSSGALCPPVSVLLRLAPVRQHAIRFDERITIGPDWDFFTRYADVGEFGYLGQTSCLYRLHGTNITLRTDAAKRRLDLATCRSNAIRMPGFANCPADVQVWAFYDLLVNALANRPDRQQEVLGWPQFLRLPASEQSRLLRLIASRAIVAGVDRTIAEAWLRESRALNPLDLRARAILALHEASPVLCRNILRRRTARERQHAEQSRPFSDLGM